MTEPSRILFLDHTAALGGAEIALLRLIGAVNKSQFCPVVLLFEDGPLAEKLHAQKIETHILELDPRVAKTERHSVGVGSAAKVGQIAATVKFVGRLRAAIRKLNVRIIHTNSLKADILGSLACFGMRKKLIWHVHDRISADYMPASAAKLVRTLARHCPHYVIANSVATAETLRLGAQPPHLVIYPGVDADMFTPQVPVKGDPVVGLVGRISPTKGQDIFVRAAEVVLRQFPRARFRIVGAALFAEKEFEQKFREHVAGLPCADHIEFTGFRADVAAQIAKMTLLVHASPVPEPFGQVVVEAMAAGKPVIATRAGGVPEIVSDPETGLLIPPGDADAMAQAIIGILQNLPAAQQMGLRGQQRARDLFTIEHTAAGVEKIWRQLLR